MSQGNNEEEESTQNVIQGSSKEICLNFKSIRGASYDTTSIPYVGISQTRQYKRSLFLQIYEEVTFSDTHDITNVSKSLSSTHIYFMTRLLQHFAMIRDYQGTSCIMAALAYSPSYMLEHIWRIGLYILEELGLSGNTSFFQFLFDLCSHDKVEVTLGMFLSLLESSNDFHQSYQVLTNKVFNKRLQPMEKVFLNAYKGLMDYTSWKWEASEIYLHSAHSSGDSCDSDDDWESKSFRSLNSKGNNKKQDALMKKALSGLKVVTQKHGIWDIFILKYVELLYIEKGYEEGLSVLKWYRNAYLNNPNAHRYLYWYQKYQKFDKDLLEETLRLSVKYELVSELTQDYLLYLRDKDNAKSISERLKILVNHLDFAGNKDNLTEWIELDNIIHSNIPEECTITLTELWKSRHDWWPMFHESQIQSGGEGVTHTNLRSIKKRVIDFFKKEIRVI